MTSEITIPVDKIKEFTDTISETACFFDAIGKMIKRHTTAKAFEGHGQPFTDAEIEGLAYGFAPVLTELLLVVDYLDHKIVTTGAPRTETEEH